MKFRYFFALLLLLFLSGCVFASDVNTTDVEYSLDVISVENQAADNVTYSQDEVLKDTAGTDIYFDAINGNNNQGDGSVNNPYKTLSSRRIKDNSIIHLATGNYNLASLTFNNVKIIGEDKDNTVLSSFNSLTFNGKSYIEGLTLKNVNCSGNDLTIDNVIVNSLLPQGNLLIKNSKFIDSILKPDSVDENTFGGAIYCIKESVISLVNCSFTGNAAEFGGAVYMENGYLTIDNCSFMNNTAFNYGGAIACENMHCLNISDSVFNNNEAAGDAGGSVYIINSNANFNNTLFKNSKSLFGGVVTSLSSVLNVSNCNFEKNNATYMGGAVYVMYGKISIYDSNFTDNLALSGGALFIDSTESCNVKSNFMNNKALLYGGAVYSFKNQATFENIYKSNTAKYFNDLYQTDRINLTVHDGGDYPLFVFNPTNYSSLPSKYNLVDYGWVTSVKNQLLEGNCWAFTALATLESCILKASNMTYDFSEENMKNIMGLYSDYGYHFMTNGGGTMDMAVGYLTSWFGPVNDSSDVYTNKGMLSSLLKSMYHVQNVVFLKRNSYTDNDMIKDAILKYGAVGTTMCYDDYYLRDYKNWNTPVFAYYCNETWNHNHAVTIVGWDDTYSKSNFLTQPEGDGAWIVRNSWGDDWGNNGYFYVSYYDRVLASINTEECAYTFLLNDTINYDKNYQYEQIKYYWWAPGRDTLTYYNLFTVEDEEYLAAASTYFKESCDYKLEIFVNNTLKTSLSGKADPGYYTIQLSDFVYLNKNDELKVAFTISNTPSKKAYFPYSKSQDVVNSGAAPSKSFFIYSNKDYDIYTHNDYKFVACIKAFTFLDKIKTDISLVINESRLIAQVSDKYGNILNKGNVIFKINNKTESVPVKDYYAVFDYDFSRYDLYNIKASWSDTGYELSENNTSRETPWDVGLSVLNITYGDDLILNISLADDKYLNDTVILKIGNHSFNVFVNQTNMLFTVPEYIDAGVYNVSLMYSTVNNYHKFSNTTLKIDKSLITLRDISVLAYQKDGNISGYFEVGGITHKNEYITFTNFTANLEGLNTNHLVVNGSKIYFKNLKSNTAYNLTVILSDANYIANQTFNIFINPGKTDLIIPDITLNYGESITLNATSDAENIILTNNISSDFISCEGKKITIGGLNTGVYKLVFKSDDENYKTVICNVTLTVNKVNSTINKINDFNFDYTKKHTLNVDYKNALNITASVVGHSDANIQIEGSNITISNLDAGNYKLNITTVVDSNHNSVSQTVNFTVNKLNVSLYVSDSSGAGSVDEITYDNNCCKPMLNVFTHDNIKWDGQSSAGSSFERLSKVIVTFNASKDNVFVNNNGSFYLKNLTPGVYDLHIQLNDSNLEGSDDFKITITKGITPLFIPEITLTYGEAVNVTANTVASAIELGEIENNPDVHDLNKDKYNKYINVDGKVITVLPGLDVGLHEIYFIIKDNKWKSQKTGVLKVNVIKANSTFTNINDINISYNESNIIFKGNVFGIDDGTVNALINNTVYNASTDINNGNFTFKISNDYLDAGDYKIIISSNSSSKNYNPPKDKIINLKINKINPKINASISDVKEDENPILIFELPSTASGIVDVEFGNKTYKINISTQNYLELPISDVGKHTVNITYRGDNNYKSESTTKTFLVSKYNLYDFKQLISESIQKGIYEVNLTHNYEFAHNDMVNITSSIIINGNNHKITANGTSAIFNILSEDVLIKNINFCSYKSQDYIFNIQNNSQFNMDNITAESVKIFTQSNAKLNINDSIIKNSNTPIISNGSVNINNVLFLNNTQAIHADNGSLNVYNSNFTNNTADYFRNIYVARNVSTNMWNNTFDVKVKITPKKEVSYSDIMIINGTYDAGVNLNITTSLIINNNSHNIAVNNDTTFKYMNNTLNAGNYTVSLANRDNHNNNYKFDNVLKEFTIAKKKVNLTIFDGDLCYEISEVEYDYNYCRPYLNIVSVNWKENNDESISSPIIMYHSWNNYTATFNGSSDNCLVENGKLYLKNLTPGYSYNLEIKLNESNYEACISKNIKINKGQTSLTIPDISVIYGTGGSVVINSKASSVKLHENIVNSFSHNYLFSKYIEVHGKTVSVSSMLPAGDWEFTFIIDDTLWQSEKSPDGMPKLSTFKVSVKKANVSFDEINDAEITYGNNDTVFITGKVNNHGINQNYTGLLNLSIKRNDKIYTANCDVNVSQDGSFKVPINVKHLECGTYTILIEGLENSNYNKIPLNDTARLKITPADVSAEGIVFDNAVYGKNISLSGKIISNIKSGFGENYTGDIEITIKNNPDFNTVLKPDKSGKFNLTINCPLTPGIHDINVNIKGNTNYTQSNKTFTFTVNKANTAIEYINVTPISYGTGQVKVTGKITGNINFGDNYRGNVIIIIEGSEKTAEVNGNGEFETIITLKNTLNKGNYDVVVNVSGDEKYSTNSKTFKNNLTVEPADISVNKININPIVYDIDNFIIIHGSITSNIQGGYGGNYTCEVIAYVDTFKDLINSSSTDINGNFEIIINLKNNTLNAGEYNLTIHVDDGGNYNAASSTATFTISKYTPQIKVEVKDVSYNEEVTVKLSCDVSGEYTVKVSDKQITTTLLKNTPNEIKFTNLTANETGYIIVAEFLQTQNYASAINDTEIVKVHKATSNVKISEVINGVFKTVNAAVKVEYADTTQITYNITKNNTEIKYGDISELNRTIAYLTAGDYEITIYGAETQNYKSSKDEAIFTILKADSSVSIIPVDNKTYNVPVDIKFTVVNETNVTWNINKDGIKVMEGAGIDNISDISLKAGNYTFTVVNKGNENYNPSQDSVSFTIKKAASEIKINSISNVTYGNSLEINFTVVNVTSVLWTIYKNNVEIICGTGNISSLILDVGNYTITIFNDENEDITSSNATSQFTVNKATSSVGVEVIANATFNTSVSEIRIVPVNGTDLTFIISKGKDKIAFGDIADIDVAFKKLGAGNYTLFVKNDGDNNHIASNDTVNFTVFKAASEVIIDSYKNITYGDVLNVTYHVLNKTGITTLIINRANGEEYSCGFCEIGELDIIVDSLSSGNYTLTLINEGNDNYTASNASCNFTVSKFKPTIKVEVGDIVYNTDAFVVVTSDVAGIYTIKIEDNQTTFYLKAGVPAEIKFSNLNANENGYIINVTYTESENYTSAVNDAEIVKVFKASSRVSISDVEDGIYKTVSATMNITVVNDTTVTFNITKNGNEVKTGALSELNSIIANLPVGQYNITIFNGENDNYNPSNATAIFNILKAGSSVVIVPVDNVTYNTYVDLNFTVVNASDVTWTLFKDGVELKNGTGLINSTGLKLAAGSYMFSVENSGNENYNDSNDFINFTVYKALSQIVVDPIVNVTYNTFVNINFIAINTINLIWRIYNNEVELLSGDGIENITDIKLPAGDYTFEISNEQTENYTGAVTTVEFSVFKVNSRISFKEFENVTYANKLFINYTIENKTKIRAEIYTAEGDFITTLGADNFTDDGVVITGLNAGNYYVEVTNYDNENITASAKKAYFTIFKSLPAITVEVNNVTYSSNIIVNVKSDVSGDYVIKVQNQSQKIVLKANKTKSVIFKGLNAGNYTINVTHPETLNYNAISIVSNITIFKLHSSVVINPIDDTTYPSQIIISYRVENKTTVKITVLDKYGKNMEYSINSDGDIVVVPQPGTFTVIIENADTLNIYGSSATAKFTVYKSSNYNFNVVSKDITAGENVTVEVTLPEFAEGRVTVVINNIEYNATVKEGKSTVVIPGLEAGKYNATVIYSGDDVFNSRNANVNITVSKSEFNFYVSSNSPVYGQNATVTVTLPDDAKGNVTIAVGDKKYNGTVSKGVATVSVPDLNHGDNKVYVTYYGDVKYVSQTVELFIHVQNIVIIADSMKRGYRSGMDYQARVVDEYGNLVRGFTLIFGIEGNWYNATTDDNGYAQIDADLSIANHVVSIINPVTGEVSTSSVNIVPRIVENSNVNMVYDDGSKYTVRVIGDDGNPVGAGHDVSITLNGRTYSVQTDARGYAGIVVTLALGKYRAEASYKGYGVSNTVVVNTHFQSKSKVTLKRSSINKKGYFRLKYNVGKYFQGKKVILKFVSKVYKVKVSKNGYVIFKVSKKIVNKLKVGKKYKYTISYKLDKKSRNIKVTKTKLIFIG